MSGSRSDRGGKKRGGGDRSLSCAKDYPNQVPMSSEGHQRRFERLSTTSAVTPILLQKSKVAVPQIFLENEKRETTADSYIPNRLAEVASEISV